jgi:uncharacterized protein (DUF2344 family)
MVSPFEMRFNVFNVAKEVMEEQYKANLAAWDLMDKASKNAEELAPKYPTVSEILEKAIEINKFISDSTERELVKAVKRASGVSVIF